MTKIRNNRFDANYFLDSCTSLTNADIKFTY